MKVMRSPLFVPGNRANMLEKALGLAPDAYVPDMEDSVPPDEKVNARVVVASFLERLASTGIPVIPRVNSLDTGLLEDDLAAVVGPYMYGVSVGKIGSADDIASISSVLSSLERKGGLEEGRVRLVPWIETAIGVINAYQICASSPRIVAVGFGAEDFTNDMAIPRSEDGSEVDYPRRVVCVAARAAGVLALDTPFFGFRDPESLRESVLAARRYGFSGQFAIHPSQIEIINKGFSPSQEETEHARRVVAAFEEAEREGKGATSLDGQVIDVPVVRRARGLLEVAEAMTEGNR